MRELEKTLMEIESAIKDHERRGNTHTQSVLQIAHEIIAVCAKYARTLPDLETILGKGGWIPVEERLPEEVDERQDILILLSSGRMVVANYVKTANKGKIFFDGYDMFHPVAWQPLPDPYCPVNKTEMPDWK